VHKKYWGGRLMPLAARPNIFYSASPGLTTIMPQTTLVQHGEQKLSELHGMQDRPGLRLALLATYHILASRIAYVGITVFQKAGWGNVKKQVCRATDGKYNLPIPASP
jgi:hypothetical protein